MADPLQDYFIQPIMQNGFFNPVNTIVYSLILIAAVVVVFKFLQKATISIDKKFFLAILPFIFWGSSTRVLHDAAVAGALAPELIAFYGAKIFPTPGSYIITFLFAFVVLLATIGVQRLTKGKVSYWKAMFTVGIIADIINIFLLPLRNWEPLLLIGGTWIGLMALLGIIYKVVRHPAVGQKYEVLRQVFSRVNIFILGVAHFLDASATYWALTSYGYFEQHVVPRTLFPLFGAESFFLLKAVVVLGVLWAIDRYGKNENPQFRNFLKIVIFILGFAPGARDLLRLVAGV